MKKTVKQTPIAKKADTTPQVVPVEVKVEKKSWIPQFILTVIVIGSIVGLGIYAYSFPSVKEMVKLATTVQPETFTELYFENHINLPKKIQSEKKQAFTFTIHNLEYKNMNYRYAVNALIDKDVVLLSSGSATLAHDAYKSIDESYTLATTSARIKIEVLLIDQDQPISFWLEK